MKFNAITDIPAAGKCSRSQCRRTTVTRLTIWSNAHLKDGYTCCGEWQNDYGEQRS